MGGVGGVRKMNIFLVYEDFVDIFGTGVISIHFIVVFKVNVHTWGC